MFALHLIFWCKVRKDVAGMSCCKAQRVVVLWLKLKHTIRQIESYCNLYRLWMDFYKRLELCGIKLQRILNYNLIIRKMKKVIRFMCVTDLLVIYHAGCRDKLTVPL